MKNPYFPCALHVRGRRCLVIGGDAETVDKAVRLARAGARVTAFASPADRSGRAALRRAGVRVRRGSARPAAVDGHFFVMVGPNEASGRARAFAERCRAKRILFCAADRPALSDVANVSLVERGLLRIAVSTGGAAPAVAKAIRKGLERALAASDMKRYLDDLMRLRRRLAGAPAAERRAALLAAAGKFSFEARFRVPPRSARRSNTRRSRAA